RLALDVLHLERQIVGPEGGALVERLGEVVQLHGATSGSPIDLSFQFRIPNSAFRVLMSIQYTPNATPVAQNQAPSNKKRTLGLKSPARATRIPAPSAATAL